MATKLVILFLSALAGTAIGVMIAKRYRAAEKYFEALLDFVNHLISAMGFSRETVKQLIDGYKGICKNAGLNKQLTDYITALEAQGAFKLDTLYFIKSGQAAAISDCFKSLGKSDSQTQVFNLKNYKERFAEYYDAAKKNNKRYGSLYIKLGFLAGAALGILLM